MAPKFEQRKNIDKSLLRIVIELENNQLPSVEDCVWLQELEWNYREGADCKELGLRIRVTGKSKIKSSLLKKEEVRHSINCMVSQLKGDYSSFSAQIRLYINKTISISKLFGEVDRKPRLGVTWQKGDCLGYIAEEALKHIKRADSLSQKKRITNQAQFNMIDRKSLSVSNGGFNVSGNLYYLLSELSEGRKKDEYLIKQHKLHVDSQLTYIKGLIANELVEQFSLGCISEGQWRDAHNELKKTDQ